MSTTSHAFARRKPPRRVILARGDRVRTFTLRPWLMGTAALVLTALAITHLAAAGYLVFRDDLLAASIARQARMQHAYEDRITALRADIDRLTSRQLLNQQAVESELRKLLSRQAALDSRQDVIADLSETARRAGIAPQASARDDAGPAAPVLRAPAADATLKTGSIAPPDGAAKPKTPSPTAQAAPVAEMNHVQASLTRLAHEQVAYVDAVAADVTHRTDTLAAILKGIGQDVPAPPPAGQDIGGPYVSLDADADPETFRANVALVASAIDRLDAVRALVGTLPLARPTLDEPVMTSPFGSRIDPFLGTPALHTGVDLRAAQGAPIEATAPGVVLTAEYTSGYGNMVEIDHGNGITTRFGHLSEIDVEEGDVLRAGTIIGKAGSTGRVTGPHLHYEVRVDGEPIDPMPYLAAGERIAPYL